MTLWVLVLATAAGCFLLKLAGYLVPARLIEHGGIRRIVELVPVALLAALVVVEAIGNGEHLQFDAARLAGFGVAAIAVWRRAPFLVVVIAAAVVAAAVRAV